MRSPSLACSFPCKCWYMQAAATAWLHRHRARLALTAARGRFAGTCSGQGAYLGAAGLHLRDNARVVALVAGDQVGALEHQANDGRVLGKVHVLARVVPVQVLLDVLVHGCMRASPIEDHTHDGSQQEQFW